MEKLRDQAQSSLLEFCAKQMVYNWENRKYRGDIVRKLHSANIDVIEYVVDIFISEKKLSEGILCQLLPSVCYHLNLTGCDFLRNSVLRQISFYCKNLVVLILDGCKQLSNYVLQSILQNCWKLETLSLRSCYLITDGPFTTSCSLFYGLHALVPLKKLCLSRCSQLSGEFATTILKNCGKLRCLDISYCRHISRDALQKLFSINFTDLDISYIPAVTDDMFIQLREHCENMKCLRLAHTSITDLTLVEVLNKCRKLETLDISNSLHLTDTSLMSLPLYTPLLSSLVLDNNDVTDAGVGRALSQLPISNISIPFCSNITDASFKNINDRADLTEVNVMWCDRLTDVTFKRLQNCKKLVKMGIKGCTVSEPLIHQYKEKGMVLF